MYPDAYPCAVPDKVQFREDPAKLAFFETRGLNPNEVARRLLDQEFRRLQALERFEKLQARKVRLGRPAAELVREDRDEVGR